VPLAHARVRAREFIAKFKIFKNCRRQLIVSALVIMT
jgi:hypothetical protein